MKLAPPQKKTIKLEWHPYQIKALNSEKRFIAVISGVQGGKTTLGALWLKKQVEAYPEDWHLIAAPTYKILHQSTLLKVFELFPEWKAFYKEQKSIIQSPFEKIVIRSTEDPKSLVGMTLRSAWLDEGGQMKSAIFPTIQDRLSVKQGRCLITTTPYTLNWLYRDFYLPWRRKDPDYEDYEVIQFESIDNPAFPKEEYEKRRRTMDPREFDKRYRGLFRKLGGLVYPDFSPKLVKSLTELFRIYKDKIDRVFGGIDFGFNNPFAVLILIEDKDKNYYVVEEFYKTELSRIEQIEELKKLREKWEVGTFYADPRDPQAIQDCLDSGLPIQAGNSDLFYGINKIRELIKEGRLFIAKHCYNLLDEIESYHYPKERQDKELKEVPVKVDDHALDALRYALASLKEFKIELL